MNFRQISPLTHAWMHPSSETDTPVLFVCAATWHVMTLQHLIAAHQQHIMTSYLQASGLVPKLVHCVESYFGNLVYTGSIRRQHTFSGAT